MGLPTRNIFVILVVVAQLAVLTKGQIEGLGACPAVNPSAAAVANTLSRTWFLYAKYFSLKDVPLTCTSYTFSNPGPNNELSLTISGRTPSLFGFGLPINLNGVLTPTNPFNTYSVTIFGSLIFPRNFVILAFGPTWLVARSCSSYLSVHLQQVFVLTTTRTPTTATINAAFQALTAQGIPTSRLVTINQSRCP